MKKPKTQYLIWEVDESEDNEKGGYWMCYDTIEAAVEASGEESVEVYEAKLVKLGTYKMKAVNVAEAKEHANDR